MNVITNILSEHNTRMPRLKYKEDFELSYSVLAALTL